MESTINYNDENTDNSPTKFESEKEREKKSRIAIMAIISTEFCERLAYYGLVSSLTLFLRRKMSETTGFASEMVSIWIGCVYVTPLIGGYLADIYLGRYKTILLFACVYLIGLIGIWIATMCYENIIPTKHVGTGVNVFFWCSLYIVAFGSGGIKPNVAPFGAEQLIKCENPQQDQQQQTSYFNWFYFSINLGSAIAYTLIAWLCQDVSFAIGYGIPAVGLTFAIFCYLSATPYYVHTQHDSSILSTFFGICVNAFQNRHNRDHYIQLNSQEEISTNNEPLLQSNINVDQKENSENVSLIVQEKQSSDKKKQPTHWLDMAKVEFGGLYSDYVFIEDCKCVFRVLQFLFFYVTYWVIYNTQNTLFYSQACQMNYYIGSFAFPLSSLALADVFVVLLLVPVMEHMVYPLLTKHNIHFPLLQRIGTGFGCSILCMLCAGLVEIARKTSGTSTQTSTCDDSIYISNLSVFWQILQYCLIGASELFASITGVQFFFDQSSSSMKSIIYSLYLITDALGSFLGALLIIIVNAWSPAWIPNNLNNGHLEYFFFLLAFMMFINIIGFVFVAQKYTYRKRKRTLEQVPLLGRELSPPLDTNNRNNDKSFTRVSSFSENNDDTDYTKSLCYRLKCW